MIKIANAPCSWGALEFDLEGQAPGYVQVLNEIAETGYAGTELGDWGFMPTEPENSPRKFTDEISNCLAHLCQCFSKIRLLTKLALKSPCAPRV
jgi:hypothetical protein